MKYSQAYVSLTQVINQMLAETMDENTITSLRSMLELSAFQPIRDVIETKIIDVGNFLKEKEEKKSLLDMMTQVRAESLKESHNVDDAVIVEEEKEDLDSSLFEYEIVMKDYFKTPRMDHPQAPWSKKDLDSSLFEYEIVMKDYFKTPRMDHPQAPWSKKDPI